MRGDSIQSFYFSWASDSLGLKENRENIGIQEATVFLFLNNNILSTLLVQTVNLNQGHITDKYFFSQWR